MAFNEVNRFRLGTPEKEWSIRLDQAKAHRDFEMEDILMRAREIMQHTDILLDEAIRVATEEAGGASGVEYTPATKAAKATKKVVKQAESEPDEETESDAGESDPTQDDSGEMSQDALAAALGAKAAEDEQSDIKPRKSHGPVKPRKLPNAGEIKRPSISARLFEEARAAIQDRFDLDLSGNVASDRDVIEACLAFTAGMQSREVTYLNNSKTLLEALNKAENTELRIERELRGDIEKMHEENKVLFYALLLPVMHQLRFTLGYLPEDERFPTRIEDIDLLSVAESEEIIDFVRQQAECLVKDLKNEDEKPYSGF